MSASSSISFCPTRCCSTRSSFTAARTADPSISSGDDRAGRLMLQACVDRAYRLRCKLNVYRTAGLAEARRYDPLRLHSISPHLLTREVPGPTLRRKHTPGEVVGGDWALKTTDFESSTHYRGFCERFVDGRPWQDTVLYRDAVNRPPGKYWHACRTEREIGRAHV